MIFPGESGFSLLTPKEDFDRTGSVTKYQYHFIADKKQYVDKRDMPRLPREKFNK